jgi:hypothetical protein
VPELHKRNPNTECAICAKPVYRRPIELETSKGKAYCSMKCYGLSCRRETPCVVCSKPILANLHKKTCSRSCANIHRAGIKYKVGRPRDKVHTLRALKLRLLEKRGINCERCGYNKSEILQVHHRDRNRKNNDLSNLELVCPNCHYEEHFLEKSWLTSMLKNKGK